MAGRGRTLVAGFGHRLSSCGWAATADVVNYDIKRRLGEWESSFVDAAGSLRQVIVARSHDEAVALRDRLNEGPAATVRELVDSRGLSRLKIEALRTVLEAALAVHGQARELRETFRESVWSVIDGDEQTVRELGQKFAQLAAPELEIPCWDDAFAFGAVVFDLDQTLVDSSLLTSPEAKRAWAANGDETQVRAFDVGGAVRPHDLPRFLADRNVKVAIVTRAPSDYAQRVCSLFDIHADVVMAGVGDKASKVRAATRELGLTTADVVMVGDDDSDVLAAREVGAVSLGPLWPSERWQDRLQPDITCREPELLLRIADWRRLGFIGELPLETDPHLHTGSWITYGTPQRQALGRYFVQSSARHSEALTQAILSWKSRTDANGAIARALQLVGERVADQACVDIVASVPPADGASDRFAMYRGIAAQAFRAEATQVLRMTRDMPGYKKMSHPKRLRESTGRFSADSAVRGLHVLLMDDVTTSGATFVAAQAALEAAGAARVSCLSFGATQD